MPNVHSVRRTVRFHETPDVTEALRGARQRGLRIDPASCTYSSAGIWSEPSRGPASAGLKAKIFAYLHDAARKRRVLPHADQTVVVLATDVEI